MDEQIRPIGLGDEIGLQAGWFSAMTVEEVRSEVVVPALERTQGGGHAVLVATRGKEIVGTLTISQGYHRLTRHRVGVAVS